MEAEALVQREEALYSGKQQSKRRAAKAAV